IAVEGFGLPSDPRNDRILEHPEPLLERRLLGVDALGEAAALVVHKGRDRGELRPPPAGGGRAEDGLPVEAVLAQPGPGPLAERGRLAAEGFRIEALGLVAGIGGQGVERRRAEYAEHERDREAG